MAPAAAPRAWRPRLKGPPRRLKLTRAGAFVLAVALALGLAAINTGNNPLFFLWGVILGGIVLSGVLSEATLRFLTAHASFAGPLRVGEPARLALRVANASRFVPAFAVSWSLAVRDSQGPRSLRAAYVLRLGQRAQRRVWVDFAPQVRGRVDIAQVRAETAYPFGLFVKTRPFSVAVKAAFVRPRKVDVTHVMAGARWRAPGSGQRCAAGGEDFAGLRDYHVGDPLRRVLWRRAARGGRWLLAEQEGERADSVVLEVRLPAAPGGAAHEETLALAGSVAEALLQAGVAVGLWTHGAAIAAGTGPEQAGLLLDALARVQAQTPLPATRPMGGHLLPLAAVLGAAPGASA